VTARAGLRHVQSNTPLFATLVATLAQADLPVDDLEDDGAAYFALPDSDGFGGLVPYGQHGLLRSFVVAPAQRGSGLGALLLTRMVDRARFAGITDLWLLTTSAERFFGRHGFESVGRSMAPPCIAATRQFTGLCPASANFMHGSVA
jgi:GNAT superfamily N-acetyltransferase